ncbi:DDE-type integrase/transposase/recombinase [Pararoseomonas sp. SCSIO 73927]|uniref:DDE-type integrase/transposase/recombinase n=1 Tax=Pararoseomonas sp. SCSIO 73927 TaxID=3114537 RepID=UPI0030D4681C
MNRRYSLEPGQIQILHGVRVSYVGRAGQEPRAHQFRDDFGTITALSDQELRDFRRLGTLRSEKLADLRRRASTGRARLRQSVVWANADGQDKAIANYRLAYVDRWRMPGLDADGNELPSTTGDAFLEAVIDEIWESRPRPVSVTRKPVPRTVRRWISGFQQHGLDGLLPQYELSGNFTERFDDTVLDYMQKGVDEYYLTDARRSVAQSHDLFTQYMKAVNKTRAVEGEPPVHIPGLRAFTRFVKMQCPFEVEYTRKGEAAARRKFHVITGGVATTRHGQRWEADHTRLNFMVRVTPDGKVQDRPWITVVIDCHTRMIVGFWIGFEAPSVETTCRALRMAILPKDKWIAQYGNGLRNPYPCEGLPVLMCTDQGSDFKARDLRERLARLKVSTLFTPVLRPYYRARVERFFLTMDRRFSNTLPGSTNSNILERDVEKLASGPTALTLDDVWRLTLKWIVDVYHVRHHRGIGNSPLRAYLESVEANEEVPPPSDQEVDAALSWCGNVMLNQQGIRIRNVFYRDAVTAEFFQHYGKPIPVPVYRTPTDLMRCHFLDPRDGEWKEVAVAANQVEDVRGRTEEEVAALQRLRIAERDTDNEKAREGEAELVADADEVAEERGAARRTREKAAAAREKMKRQYDARYAHGDAATYASSEAITGDDFFGLGVTEAAQLSGPATAAPAGRTPRSKGKLSATAPLPKVPAPEAPLASGDDDDVDAYRKRYDRS